MNSTPENDAPHVGHCVCDACRRIDDIDTDVMLEDLQHLHAINVELLTALKAAQQFLGPEISRGPAVNGWQNTVDLVRVAIANAETL